MTLIPIRQCSSLREHRVEFMRVQLEAFDVDDNFSLPLALLEQLVLKIEGPCFIESTCKVEGDRIFGGRFNICDHPDHLWPGFLQPSLTFIENVGSQVGIEIDYSLLSKFLELHIDSPEILYNSVGVDLRPQIKDSSLKIHLQIKTGSRDLVQTALSLDGGNYSAELVQALIEDVYLIGFDFFLDGNSAVELYVRAAGGKSQDPEDFGQLTRAYVRKNFSSKVNALMDVSDSIMMGFSKANSQPVIYFNFSKIQDIPKYFRLNDWGNRAYDFYKSRGYLEFLCLGFSEQDLESSRLDNVRFYYATGAFA